MAFLLCGGQYVDIQHLGEDSEKSFIDFILEHCFYVRLKLIEHKKLYTCNTVTDLD